ncbi:MAG TPA: alkaline phosphatase family protein [Candidatus Binatia bacterium]|nr:alkaline phosphatase family protein [Candidatus Binatia bacterium]
MFRCKAVTLFLIGVVLTAAACSSGAVSPSAPEGVGPALSASTSKIQHIVIVVQEARSFDDLFCAYGGAEGKCADQTIPLEANCTLSDTFQDYERDRKTGKFGKEHADCPGYQRPEYAHVPASELAQYYQIAQQYVLGDEMYSSTGNPTFEAHQYLTAAEAGNAENQPFGRAPKDDCVYHQWVRIFKGGKTAACFTYETLGDELTATGLSWRYYRSADSKQPIVNTWDAYGWVKGGSSGISPSSQFIQDVCSGTLATVTWVTPAFSDSDLSGSLSSSGPKWVASVVNAVGESQFWSSSAVVVVWSGFGGWYDHVRPQFVDFEGLGFRVPVLVVSPYALSGSVDHVHFETGSILKFVEDTFGLQPLAVSDKRARDLGVSTLDMHQRPRAFMPVDGGSGCDRR